MLVTDKKCKSYRKKKSKSSTQEMEAIHKNASFRQKDYCVSTLPHYHRGLLVFVRQTSHCYMTSAEPVDLKRK